MLKFKSNPNLKSNLKLRHLWILFILSLSFVSNSIYAKGEVDQNWLKQATARCAPSNHDVLYRNEMKWKMSLSEASELYAKLYSSEKRLQHRFYYSASEKAFKGKSPISDAEVRIPIEFLFSLKRHVEEALRLEYAQWVFFPDMGHNHFFLPQKTYDAISGLPRAQMLEAMLGAPELKVLYHTFEQLRAKDDEGSLLPDSWTQWRYYTRNIIGDNQGLGALEIHKNLTGNYNTVSDYEDFKYWGAGVNISANKDGCFAFEHDGQVSYFDVSFYDLPYKNESN